MNDDRTTVNMFQTTYDSMNDPHVRAIDRLIEELGISAEEVNRSYREVLNELEKDNTVKFFLPMLVSSIVKERLSYRGSFESRWRSDRSAEKTRRHDHEQDRLEGN